MKRFLFLCIMVVTASYSIAQTTPTEKKVNKQFVGCAVSAWNNSDADYWSLQFTPKYGYNLSSLWAVGVSLDYAHESAAGQKSNQYGINPFLRCKYMIAPPVVLFADFGVNYCIKQYDNNVKPDENNAYIGARPGIAYIMSDRFSIAAYFGFIGYRYSDAPAGTNNGGGFSLSTNGLSLGLNIHF